MISVNPATGCEIRQYNEMDGNSVQEAVSMAVKMFRNFPVQEQRAEYLKKAAIILRERATEYAEIMALEMGKPVSSGKAESEKCAWVCEYYAEKAFDFLRDIHIETGEKSYVSHQPLGPVLAIMPWNFPFWQVFRFAAPALMAGNTVLLKHASNVPGCALAIEKIFIQAGFPKGVFQTLLINSSKALELVRDKRISAVTLTGSTEAGRSVASACGAVIKKCVLELGGSDPYLILSDADLEKAVQACTKSRLINSGQSCIGAKRFIVVSEVYDRFLAMFTEEMKKAVTGDPMDQGTQIGPLARPDLVTDLHRQVMQSIEAGAKCECGGNIPDEPGNYYPPTVLSEVKKGMPAYEEELFGPVAAVIRADNEDHAIEIANDTSFGLGAAVFTKDLEKGEMIAREKLEAGCCFVNDFVRSDPRLPFGGIKESGYGRELSRQGILEFVNVKTVYVT